MKNAILYILSGALGVVIFDATLTPFVSAVFQELGIHPENWAAPTVRSATDFVSSEQFIAGLYGGAGALCYSFVKSFIRAMREERAKKKI